MIDKYIALSKSLALINQETPFFRFFIPFITLIGCSVFFYYGYRGIVKKKTISLYKYRGLSARESQELLGNAITGTSAVVFGIIYILLGLLLLVALGGSSWFMIFGV